MEELMYLG